MCQFCNWYIVYCRSEICSMYCLATNRFCVFIYYLVNYGYSLKLLLYCPCVCCHFILWWCADGFYIPFYYFISILYFYRICAVLFIICLYMYCRRRSNYHEGTNGIPLTELTLPHVCACSKPGPWFRTPFVVIFFFKDLIWEAVVHIVNIGGIVYHYCLSLLFAITTFGNDRQLLCMYKRRCIGVYVISIRSRSRCDCNCCAWM